MARASPHKHKVFFPFFAQFFYPIFYPMTGPSRSSRRSLKRWIRYFICQRKRGDFFHRQDDEGLGTFFWKNTFLEKNDGARIFYIKWWGGDVLVLPFTVSIYLGHLLPIASACCKLPLACCQTRQPSAYTMARIGTGTGHVKKPYIVEVYIENQEYIIISNVIHFTCSYFCKCFFLCDVYKWRRRCLIKTLYETRMKQYIYSCTFL